MGRTESKQAFQQSSSQSAQDQANAQAALAATNKSVGDYTKNVDNFMRFGRRTFGANGEYMKDQNVLATTTAKAGSDKIGGDLALNAMRTGENTSGYAGTLAESQRQGSRDLTDQLARADANRLSQLTAVNQYGVDAAKFPAQVYGSLYGQGTSAAGNEMGSASSAAKGAGAAAAGFCPCAGSMIRMGDCTEKPVEQLKKGDFVWSLSTSAPPNEVLETPLPAKAHSFLVRTREGREHSGSATHTLALAIGGYAFMPESLNQVVLAENATDIVSEVEDIGDQTVCPLKIGGSHTYMADGIWILA